MIHTNTKMISVTIYAPAIPNYLYLSPEEKQEEMGNLKIRVG